MDITSQVYMVYVLMIFFVLLNDAQSIIRETPGSLGSTVTLPCQDTGGSGIVVWTKIFTNGTEQDYSGNQYISQAGLSEDLKNRLRITGNYAVREYNLEISNLKQSDEGNYKCTSTFKELKRVHLYIPEPPTAVSVPTLTDQNRILGTEDQDLTITCTAIGGKPPPEVTLKGKNDNYFYKTDIQSLLYTFSMIKRDFDLKKLLCEANSSALTSPLKQEVQIYLDLKPFPPDISPEPEASENTTPLHVVCTSRGSRPKGSIYWKIGETSITAHSTQNTTHDLSTDTYTMTSELTYTVDRSHNGQRLTCGAVNKILNSGRETSKTVSVTFAPDVSVSNVTFYQNDSTRTVTCTAVGNPPVYGYSWRHMSFYGVMIREWKNLKTGVLNLPSIAVEYRYQDSGEYKCTVSNGLTDAQGNAIIHTGSGFVMIKAQPVFTSDNNINLSPNGEIGKQGIIHVNVFSIPIFNTPSWRRGTGALPINTAKYKSEYTKTVVADEIHGRHVQLDGYKIILTIYNLKEDDFTNYTLQLSNGIGQITQHTVALESLDSPNSPVDLSIISSTESTITVKWIQVQNDESEQIFHIEFRKKGIFYWFSVGIPHDDNNKQELQHTLAGLQPGTEFQIRMYATNQYGKSEFTDIVEATTMLRDACDQTSLAAVVGGVAGGLVTVIVILVALLIRNRWRGNKRNNYDNSSQKAYQSFDMKETDNTYEEMRSEKEK